MDIDTVAKFHTISTAELATLGYLPDGIRRLVQSGRLRRLIRGWYAVAPQDGPPPWGPPEPWARERANHRLTLVAVLRSFEGRVAASHQSALVLAGAPLWRSDLSLVHVCRVADHHSRHRRGAVLHAVADLATVTTPEGFASVPPALAAVQVGLVPHRRQQHPEEFLVTADWLMHTGAITREDIDAALAATATHTGINRVRPLAPWVDGRHESPGESLTAVALRRLHYPATPQVELVVDGIVYRVDFMLDDANVVVEFDGHTKYSTGGTDHDVAAMDVLRREKRREDRLREAYGVVFVRLTWADLDHPGRLRARLARAVHAAGRRSA